MKQRIYFTTLRITSFVVVVQSLSHALQPHELQHTRLSCPSLSPSAYSNSCPLSRWCHPTILSFVTPLLLLPSIFPSVRSFPVSWLFTSGGQRIGASISASVISNEYWFPLESSSLIFLLSKGLSKVFSSTTVRKHQCFGAQPLMVPLSHSYMSTIKISFDYTYLFGKVMSLLFSTLSRFVIAFLLKSKCLLMSWLLSLSTVIFFFIYLKNFF